MSEKPARFYAMYDPGPEKAPRYPVRSLSDADLIRELGSTTNSEWSEACRSEAKRRGLRTTTTRGAR